MLMGLLYTMCAPAHRRTTCGLCPNMRLPHVGVAMEASLTLQCSAMRCDVV